MYNTASLYSRRAWYIQSKGAKREDFAIQGAVALVVHQPGFQTRFDQRLTRVHSVMAPISEKMYMRREIVLS